MDLTKIEKPFGLLDEEAQEALKDHFKGGGGLQYYCERGWRDVASVGRFPASMGWHKNITYRAKPEPVVKEYMHKLRVSSGVYDWTPPLFSQNIGDGWIDGTTTSTVIDGKPTRIVWEADQ